jgi:hypothetical protein
MKRSDPHAIRSNAFARLAGLAVAALAAACSPAATNGAAQSSASSFSATGAPSWAGSASPAPPAPAAQASAPTPTDAQNPSGGQLQPASAGDATTFTDPTENAFTVTAPQGWTIKGGVQRAANSAKTWVVATSADGATTIILGDPSIPNFVLPSPFSGNQANVAPYETSVQFAGNNAQHAFGSTCAGLTPTGDQPEPEMAQLMADQGAKAASQMGVAALPASAYDGGSATFSCQTNGVADAVGVIDVTSVFRLQNGGLWGVPLLIAYRTPAATQAQTDQVARTIRASFQPNPQWQAQQLAAARQQQAAMQQQGAAAQAALTRQEGAEGQMLSSQAASENAQLDAEHAATMAQLNAQGQRINQNFAIQQYNKGSGQQAEMRYINDQTCVRWYDAAHTRCAETAPN